MVNSIAVKITFMLIALSLFSLQLKAQENYIQLTKNSSGKTKIIQELKRVKIKTLDGQKYIGNLVIVNKETLRIDKTEIPISEVVRIKRKSRAASTISTLLYTFGGLVFVTTTVIVTSVGGLGASLAAIFGYPISVLSVGLAALTNDYPINNPNSKWSYNIILNE